MKRTDSSRTVVRSVPLVEPSPIDEDLLEASMKDIQDELDELSGKNL